MALTQYQERRRLALFVLLIAAFLALLFVGSAWTEDVHETIEVAGQVPLAGTLTVELACRRDRLKFVPASRRPRGSSTPDWQAMNTTYRRANDHVWTSETCHVQRGTFRIKITVPRDAQGPSHVRCYLAGPTAFAIGAADLYVRRAGKRPSLAAQPNNKPAPR